MNFVRRMFRQRESHVRFWGGRLSVGFHALCLGAGYLFLVLSSSAAGLDVWNYFVFGIYLLPVVAWWFIRLIGWAGSGVKDETRGWLFAPGLAVVAILIAFSGLPTFVRFSMSRGAFEAEVEALEATSTEFLQAPPRVGSFEVEAVRKDNGGYIFHTQSGEILETTAGFAYLPYGPASETAERYNFRSLGGDWYSWKL